MKLRSKRPYPVLIAPQGRPDIEVDANAVFDVDDELGVLLLEQEDNYEAVLGPKPAATAAPKED